MKNIKTVTTDQPLRKMRLRTIRSFVRREGRLTAAQKRALETLWPEYGIDTTEQKLDLESIFGRCATLTLEIGFGNGESLAKMAQAAPEGDFIGIEVHQPGVGNLLQTLKQQNIHNVRILCDDAVEALRNNFSPESLDQVQIYFPDPWPKKRHHKRRLIQAEFIALLASRLKPGGILHIATDWQDYAAHIIELMQTRHDFIDTASQSGCQPRPDFRPETKFERRGLRLGHPVCDLIYRRQ